MDIKADTQTVLGLPCTMAFSHDVACTLFFIYIILKETTRAVKVIVTSQAK